MEALTISKAQELLDKTIEWSAPSAEGNTPYGGKAVITDIQANARPLICTTIEGDNLNYAICEDDVHIDYSDEGRGVIYKVIEDIYVVNDTETGNCVIYNGNNLADAVAEILNDMESEEPTEWDLYKNGERIWCGSINTKAELVELLK
jgi:hypothetical protein